jgi:hypothetical protein
MKKLSETLKGQGIDFAFPIKIKDANGNQTYYETSGGFWVKYEYDANGNGTYYENSNGFWVKYEYGANGNETYHENSNGFWVKYEYGANGNHTYVENSNGEKYGTPKSAKPCEGKAVEIDGVKYELKAL